MVLYLNVKNALTCIQTIHIGSLNNNIVHPRKVLKPAMLGHATSIIFAHNHRIVFMLDIDSTSCYYGVA
ncbi:JAB domain-containing protein [Bacillus paranthracis]|uniref:JAB domain-containing protein n=1 Tax=Bacillus paranthracis TaxID=2026186 RepID=UPI0015824B86|nr:JAB domain-containing protein [Bacillus paranthracis]NUJ04498.1 hypothetical protein [Bacillus paranthracis]